MPNGTETDRPVLRDVARLAGTSVSTVSRVLSGAGPVADETAQRVRRAVRETGFVLNHTKSAAARSRSGARSGLRHNAIGLGGPGEGPDHLFAGHPAGCVREAVLEYAHELRLSVTFCPMAVDDLRQGIVPSSVTMTRLDGVLMHPARGVDPALLEAVAPVALFGSHPTRDCVLPSAEPDSEWSIDALVGHLRDLGHRRFLYLSHNTLPPDPHRSYIGRRLAFTDSVAARDSAGETVDLPAYDVIDFGAAFAARPAADRPTAIVVSNDGLAIKLMARFAELGVRVPDEVSVTGFDGTPLGADVYPTLTTWRPDWALIGRTALELLLERVRGVRARKRVHIGGELLVRGSTAPPDSGGA